MMYGAGRLVSAFEQALVTKADREHVLVRKADVENILILLRVLAKVDERAMRGQGAPHPNLLPVQGTAADAVQSPEIQQVLKEAMKQLPVVQDGVDVTQDRFVTCSVCGLEVCVDDAHLYHREYIGDCCWDERLKTTERGDEMKTLKITVCGQPKTGKTTVAALIEEMLTSLSCKVEVNDPDRGPAAARPGVVARRFSDIKVVINVEQEPRVPSVQDSHDAVMAADKLISLTPVSFGQAMLTYAKTFGVVEVFPNGNVEVELPDGRVWDFTEPRDVTAEQMDRKPKGSQS